MKYGASDRTRGSGVIPSGRARSRPAWSGSSRADLDQSVERGVSIPAGLVRGEWYGSRAEGAAHQSGERRRLSSDRSSALRRKNRREAASTPYAPWPKYNVLR